MPPTLRAMNALPNILVVDDDADITQLLSAYLQRYRFNTCTAHDAASMRQVLQHTPVDLVVLDLMLPGTDGMALAQELRAQTRLPIIMLTARTSAFDRILGLENGADDYLTKPFEPRELVARIQSVLRRCGLSHGQATPTVASAGVVRFDGWQLDRARRHLQSPTGTVVPLSDAEYRLLNTFLSKPHALFTRDQLLEQARGRGVDQLDRSIDLLVSRLRHKLATPEGCATSPVIKTVRGAGYMFTARSVAAGVAWS